MPPPQSNGEQERPASPHAEMTILGGMLVEPAAIRQAIDLLESSDFALDSHRKIFAAILALNYDQQPVDIVTVADELKRRKELDAVGGISYIASLSEGLPRKLSIQSYVRIVRDKSLMRSAMTIADRTMAEAADQSERAMDVIQRSISDLQQLADNTPDNDLQQVGDYLATQGEPEEILESLTTLGGLEFGFADLDKLVGGVQGGELVIVAARPSMGKTAWACNASQNVAIRNNKVSVLFALEQKKKAMIRRMLSSAARVDYRNIRRGEVSHVDKALMLEHRSILANAPLYIDDKPGLTVTRIKSKCMRLKERSGLNAVFIDQLSKISMADCRERDFRLKVGEQTAALKRMAQELDVPVIVFNQLSRETGKRADPRPRLEDLKESGNIEEDADIVILLHRPEYYDKSDTTLVGKGEMIVAKNREGETGTVECTYQARILRWEDGDVPVERQASFSDKQYAPPYYDRD